MIAEIVPGCVEVVARDGDVPEDTLWDVERESVSNAVAKRRGEFATGRACAREALTRLGFEPQAIAAGEGGAPVWPGGVVGSITHCDGYRAAAVARRSEILTLGIDAEPHAPLPDGLLPDVSLPVERRWIQARSGQAPEIHWDRLLFCMKESVYKAWYPLARRWLGFEDASIEIDGEAGAFRAELLVEGPSVDGRRLQAFEGRWSVSDGIAMAAIATPPH